MVPRAQAAQAYKNVVRQQVDPALLEWAGAGVFQTRVFPLEPKRVHRIVVGYEIDLVRLANGQYELAFDLPGDVPELSLDLHVSDEASVEPSAAATWSGTRTTYAYRDTDVRSFRVRSRPGGQALVTSEDTGFFALSTSRPRCRPSRAPDRVRPSLRSTRRFPRSRRSRSGSISWSRRWLRTAASWTSSRCSPSTSRRAGGARSSR